MSNGVSIKDLSTGRFNNFDFIRFIAASIVIISHSFPLSYGNNNKEILYMLTKNQTTLGTVAVDIFFIISGFLIARSWDRTKDITKFLKARVLRIFPGLIVVILLSILFLGAIFTTHPLSSYFRDTQTYKYLVNITLVKMQFNLPGVFENNIYKNAVNGSIWTLEYEFGCYIVIAILGVTRLLKKTNILIIFIIAFIFNIIKVGNSYTITLFISLFVQFLTGTLLYVYGDIIKLKFSYVLGCVALLTISSQVGGFEYALALFLPYIIMYLAFCPKIKLNNFASNGDMSYGIYIYAFPIQQIVVHLFGGKMQWYMNFIIAFPIIVLCSFLSWHLIEKPCMKLKNLNIKQFKSLLVKDISSTSSQ